MRPGRADMLPERRRIESKLPPAAKLALRETEADRPPLRPRSSARDSDAFASSAALRNLCLCHFTGTGAAHDSGTYSNLIMAFGGSTTGEGAGAAVSGPRPCSNAGGATAPSKSPLSPAALPEPQLPPAVPSADAGGTATDTDHNDGGSGRGAAHHSNAGPYSLGLDLSNNFSGSALMGLVHVTAAAASGTGQHSVCSDDPRRGSQDPGVGIPNSRAHPN